MSKPSYNFDYLPDRRHTESSKWNLFDEDVLPMWVADMDFYCPPEVTRALAQRVQHGIFGYGNLIPELFEVTAAWIQNHYHWKVDPDDLVCLWSRSKTASRPLRGKTLEKDRGARPR